MQASSHTLHSAWGPGGSAFSHNSLPGWRKPQSEEGGGGQLELEVKRLVGRRREEHTHMQARNLAMVYRAVLSIQPLDQQPLLLLL